MKINSDIIQKWKSEKLISAEQAEKMEADLVEMKQRKSSSLWIIAISTIGAILLGVAAITFISANWEVLSRFEKITLAFAATFGSFGIGFYLAEIQRNFPKLGNALILLSTILFGATLALISQVYHLDGNPAGLFALWAIGILPVAYLLNSNNVMRLSALVVFISFVLFLGSSDIIGFEAFEAFVHLGLLAWFGVFLFAVGSLHYLSVKFQDFGKILRMWGIRIAIFFLFFLTFGEIVEEVAEEIEFISIEKLLLSVVVAAAAMGFYYLKSPRPEKEKILEASLWGSNALLILIFLLFSEEGFSVLFFNLLFIANLVIFLKESYRRENQQLLNFALFATGVFIFGKYIQFFADLLEGATFFFVGGLVLIALGFFLEKQRRELKSKLTH
jgi:uncharacterized membrane protein